MSVLAERRMPVQRGAATGMAAAGPLVCIAAKRDPDTVETFIRSHMQRLPLPVRILSGIPPHTDNQSGFVLTRPLIHRLLYRLGPGWARPTEEEERIDLTARYLRKHRFGVVLAEYGDVGVMIAPACARAGVPLIVHFHGHDAYSSTLLAAHREHYVDLFRQGVAFVAVSTEMVEQLIALGAPRDRVHYISYHVDGNRFAGGSAGTAPPHFVGVGRFVETKAPYLTLAAFAQMHRRVPDARLTIIGDGPLRAVCLHLAEYFGVADAVSFPGSLSHEAVAEAMSTARAFVQHSVCCLDNTREGTPNAVLEAQASGLPVVATRHAGIKDVVAEGETGFLVDERDVGGMADAMLRLAQDPALAARLGAAGRQRVLDLFSFDNTLGRLASLLQEVSSHQPRSSS
jgi:glycosyltransferase involved in cell wall biosynthesis